ncbi:tyrosine-type recombinase/integrase [Streptomyces olivoreticuli]
MSAVVYPDAVQAKDEWLESLHGRTRGEYGRDVRRYFEHCDRRETNPLDARQVEVDTFRTWLDENGLGPKSWNRARAAVKSFYTYVVRDPQIRCKHNPVEGSVRAKVSKKQQQTGFMKEEAEELLAEAYYSGNERLHMLVLTILDTGSRPGGLLAADIPDLGYEQGVPVLRTIMKGEEAPVVTVLNKRVHRGLLKLIGDRTSGPIWITRSGKRLTRQGAYDMLMRLARRVLKFRPTFRKGRRTFISLSLALGIPLDHIQESVHHKDPRTTKGYDDGLRALSTSPTFALERYVKHPEDPAEELLPARPALSVVRDSDEVIAVRKADLVRLITEEVMLRMQHQPAAHAPRLVAA